MNLSAREKELQSQLKALRAEKELLRQRKQWTCPSCNRRTQLKKLIVVSKWWYEQPHGCTGGAEWWPSDDYEVWCPKCEDWIRVYSRYVYHSDTNERRKLEREKSPDFFYLKDNSDLFAEFHCWYPSQYENSFDLDKLRQQTKERQSRRYY